MSKKNDNLKLKVNDETSKNVSVKNSRKDTIKSSKNTDSSKNSSKISEKKKGNSIIKKLKVSKNYYSLIVGLIIGLLFIGLSFFITNLSDKTSNVVAIYDGAELSSYDFNKSVDISLFLQGSPTEYKNTIPREQLLNQTILLNVLFDRAKVDGHLVEREGVITFIDNSLLNTNTSLEEFKIELVSENFNYEDLVIFFIKQNTINSYVSASIQKNLNISDEEILAYYNEQKASYVGEFEIKASHILVDTEGEANNVISMLNSGSDFANLAKSESIGPSSVNGGDLGFFGMGAMVLEFEVAAFGLENIGDYTKEPVKTSFGYHIIKLVDKKRDEVPEFSLIKDKISDALKSQKKSLVTSEFITETMNSIEIKYK
jgi:parvulin-like peptidyl-prolyl isomerase